ncbi:major facilitator superfamily domain-containing protein [Lipomyces oligophaga]|uniref:major facilitator superfamily domain-containing protein n=1 Tax=Lipomyces oligophaga TaxID=45792 RepID=UPI0034CD101C
MPNSDVSGTSSAIATVTKLNVIAYLFSCFCSIAFLVFLNATQSFVITVLLHFRQHIGDYVGTLGFVDELVSVVMCPLWGTLSDKIGTRTVAATAYLLVGTGLILFVQGRTVYPGLFILRMFFALGGSGTAAMVTALLSEVSSFSFKTSSSSDDPSGPSRSDSAVELHASSGNSVNEQLSVPSKHRTSHVRNGTLSGLVGLCTGLGAVMAVTLFLPLPNRLERMYSLSPEGALRGAFYIVGVFALVVSVVLHNTLRHDPAKSLTKWIRSIRYKRRRQAAANATYLAGNSTDQTETTYEYLIEEEEDIGHLYLEERNNYFRLLIKGFTAASEPDIFLAYVGGLIARAASVAVSLFIPLFVNQWFHDHDLCDSSSDDEDMKSSCRDAYILSAILTGVAETCALVAAPFWGILCDKADKPSALAITALVGTFGFFGFANISDNLKSGTSFLWAIAIGVSQIGAIVCSLALCTERKTEYSGSIAGVYSVTGAAGILLLTKLGGWASDHVSRGAPFVIMGIFNILLGICAVWVMFHDGLLGDIPFLTGTGRIKLPGADVLLGRTRSSLAETNPLTESESEEGGE